MGPEQAQAEIVANLMAWDQVEPRRMFGCDAYLVQGKMFAFFQDEGLFVKVPSPQRERLLEDARVRHGAVAPLPHPASLPIDRLIPLPGEDQACPPALARA